MRKSIQLAFGAGIAISAVVGAVILLGLTSGVFPFNALILVALLFQDALVISIFFLAGTGKPTSSGHRRFLWGEMILLNVGLSIGGFLVISSGLNPASGVAILVSLLVSAHMVHSLRISTSAHQATGHLE